MTEFPQRATFTQRRDHLDRLAGALAQFDREITLTATGTLILIITHPARPAVSEQVLCAHDPNGSLAYFWPWGERIAGVHHTLTAAHKIARVLESR